jgi:hypothetical protein
MASVPNFADVHAHIVFWLSLLVALLFYYTFHVPIKINYIALAFISSILPLIKGELHVIVELDRVCVFLRPEDPLGLHTRMLHEQACLGHHGRLQHFDSGFVSHGESSLI